MSLRRFATAATVALTLSFSMTLTAQGVTGFVATGSGVGFHVPAAPYTATVKTTSVQKLANGTTITHESERKIAHDSVDRIFVETHTISPDSLEGQREGVYSYSVNDPANHTFTHWTSTQKEATVEHLPEPSSGVRPVQANAAQEAAAPRGPRPKAEVHKEQLGTKTIAGMVATGVRITRIIPVGAEGNDQPLTITDEHWNAADLRLDLLSIHDDPRRGTTTNEVTEVELGEPDASLFQIPEGYTVTDHYFTGQANH